MRIKPLGRRYLPIIHYKYTQNSILYRFAHATQFPALALPQIERAVDWLKKVRAADLLRIMPAGDVHD